VNADYIARLKQAIERRLRLRGAFTSQLLNDDNEAQLRHAIESLAAAELEVSVS
jgi:hypothetical protein